MSGSERKAANEVWRQIHGHNLPRTNTKETVKRLLNYLKKRVRNACKAPEKKKNEKLAPSFRSMWTSVCKYLAHLVNERTAESGLVQNNTIAALLDILEFLQEVYDVWRPLPPPNLANESLGVFELKCVDSGFRNRAVALLRWWRRMLVGGPLWYPAAPPQYHQFGKRARLNSGGHLVDNQAPVVSMRRRRMIGSREVPAEWSREQDDHAEQTYTWLRNCRQPVVPPRSEEHTQVCAQLYESIDGVEVRRVERIQHRLLLKRFNDHCEELDHKNHGRGGANILTLWHGTEKPSTVLSSELGLDAMRSSDGFYGRGIYFAEHAMYSNGDKERSYAATTADGSRQLLLCRVATGVAMECGVAINRNLRQHNLIDEQRSRASGSEILFDSLRGGPHSPGHAGGGPNASHIYVVYQNASVYPAYLVTYSPRVGLVDGMEHGVQHHRGRRREDAFTIIVEELRNRSSQIYFKVWSGTKWAKLLKILSPRLNVQLDHMRLIVGSERIYSHDPAASVGSSGVQPIWVGLSIPRAPVVVVECSTLILIRSSSDCPAPLRLPQHQLQSAVWHDTPLEGSFGRFARGIGLQRDALDFMLEGRALNGSLAVIERLPDRVLARLRTGERLVISAQLTDDPTVALTLVGTSADFPVAITLSFGASSGEQFTRRFTVSSLMPFYRVFRLFAAQCGTASKKLRFVYRGFALPERQCPAGVGMGSDAQIAVDLWKLP